MSGKSSDIRTNSSVQDITFLSTQQKLNLSSWGLPDAILKRYEVSGIVTMFPWQVECLSNPQVLKGGNLIYSAPTSAGKTLVAEILAIKTVLEKKKKVIIILPFVSVVREKMFYFQDLLSSSGVRVAGLMGNHSLPGGFKSVDIAICTIEKANSLINRLLEEGSLQKVGAVVVDELHLLGDPFRGYLLELLLTKILYMCNMEDRVKIQVVGMSATLPNLSLLATWLGADLYRTDFRPVPLNEFLKVGPTVYDNQMKKLYDMQSSKCIQDDPDHVVQLCLETLINGHSVLVFCATKQWCEKLSQHIAQVFKTIGFSGSNLGQQLREQLNSDAIAEALEQLRRCPVGLDKVLGCTVAFGVAFHHAGLTIDERDILEGCFRAGTVRVLVATSTLSSGVNLPARRVIVRSPVFHGKSLDAQSYRQMIGRAGRMGRDTAGESFLLCHKGEGHIGEKLVKADLKPIESCLGHGELAASLKRAILEVIASGVASTPEQVAQYTNCTLLATTKSDLQNPVSTCVQFLEDNEFIRLQEEENSEGHKYTPTPLGLACLAASLPPDEGLRLFDELQRARQCFVLDTELHIIYEVTPYSVCSQWGNLDWLHVLGLWEQLPPSMRRVGELVGIEERFMVRAMRGTLALNTAKQLQKMSVHRRFYTALALHDLVNEVPLAEVARKFGCSRGMLQSLQQSAATFAGMVTAFCRRLGWSSVELLVSQFQDRLQFGIQRELCDLMRLDGLNGPRARALFDGGISTLPDLAAADVCTVENALHKAVPFQSCKELDGETSFDTKQRKKFRNVWVTGRQGLTERDAAFLLISDARSFLQKELGLADAKWERQESESSGYDSQSPSRSNHSLQESPQICNESSNQNLSSSNLCHLQQLQLLEKEPKTSVTNHMLIECEENSSICSTVSKKNVYSEEVLAVNGSLKHLSSGVEDEDCLSSSPLSSNCSSKSSHKQKSRKFCSRLGKYKNKRRYSDRIIKNISGNSNTHKSKQNISFKIPKNVQASKLCEAESTIASSNETQDFENSVNPEETKQDQNLLNLSSPLQGTTDDKVTVSSKKCNNTSETINHSVDYFGTPLEISETKLHEKTQQYKENDSSKMNKEMTSENISEEVENSSKVVVKKHFLKKFLSSLRIDSTVKRNDYVADKCDTDICVPYSNINEEIKPLRKGDDNKKIHCQNVNPLSFPLCVNMREIEKVSQNLPRVDSKRKSSDFLSSPTSGGKCVSDVENDNQSPSLFGDSFVVDTQLNEVLNACCNKHQTDVELNCKDQILDCNQKSPPENSGMKHCQNTELVCNDTCFITDNDVKNYKNFTKQKMKFDFKKSHTCDEKILNSTTCSTENVIASEFIRNETERRDEEKEKLACKEEKVFNDFPSGIVTAREVLQWNNAEVKTPELNCVTVNEEKLNSQAVPVTTDILSDSLGRKGVLLYAPTDTASYNEISENHSVYSEEIEFHSVTEQTVDFKMKNGFVSPITYQLNEKLQVNSCKNVAPLRRKRNISTSDDSHDSNDDSDLKSSKRSRMSNVISKTEDTENKKEITMKTEFSILKEIGNTEHLLNNNNRDESKSDSLQPKELCSYEKKHLSNEEIPLLMKQNMYTKEREISDQENGDPISDSFLEEAFNTYWDLDAETEEKKIEDNIHNRVTCDDVSNNHGKISLSQKPHPHIPSSVSDIECDKHERSCKVTPTDVSTFKPELEDLAVVKKINESCFLINNSLLEGAFNTCWENEESDHYTGKIQKSSSHTTSNTSQTHNNVESMNEFYRHSKCNLVSNAKIKIQSSSKEKITSKNSIAGRRRSPRLLAVLADKKNETSGRKSLKDVNGRKTSFLLEVEKHNESSSKMLLGGADRHKNVIKKKKKIVDVKNEKKMSSEVTFLDCKGKVAAKSLISSPFPVECDQSPQDSTSNKEKVEPRTVTPTGKGMNSPTLSVTCNRTKANKILQFSSDSSDGEAEDDLIISSQGDEEPRRKRHCTKPEGVKLKISRRDLRSTIRSSTQSQYQPEIVNSKPLSGVTDIRIKKKKGSSRKDIAWDSINIVDVSAHEKVWAAFQSELNNVAKTNVAIAAACEHFIKPHSTNHTNSAEIGAKIVGYKNKKPQKITHERTLSYGERLLNGMALCFGGRDVFYIDLKNNGQECVGLQCKLDFIQDLLRGKQPICAFDLKEHLKTLTRCCGIMVELTEGHDPKVGDWLMEPEGREKNLHAMVLKYCGSKASKLADLIGKGWGVGSPSLDWRSATSPRLRACVEAVLSWQLVDIQFFNLKEKKLDNIYAEVEMPTLFCLTRMELNGIGFNKDEAERLRDLLEQQLNTLEQHAYKLAGHTFSLTSSADVGKVLYKELALTAGKLSSKQRHPSTNKEALMHIKGEHPLPGVILQWRKLNAVATKTLFPLLAPGQTSGRMFTSSVIHTATGRISMHEPNLQNIPRDFDVVIDKMTERTSTPISMRLAFVPGTGKLFVSADYCQLELRLLAHLAKDAILSSILNSGGDVFCRIAASWNRVSESEVTSEQRQWAKQVCYGMIYGMGAKALGEQLEIEEEDATVFIDKFKNAYPDVKQFLMETVAQCRKRGYIETLFGRRRHLPTIYSSNKAIQSQAERQAINSTVQGSAADVAKKGMVLVESQLRNSGFTSLNAVATEESHVTASLALHLHDELLFEVSHECVMEVAQIVKFALENAVTLSVRLPVKVKVGKTWGSLKEISLDVD